MRVVIAVGGCVERGKQVSAGDGGVEHASKGPDVDAGGEKGGVENAFGGAEWVGSFWVRRREGGVSECLVQAVRIRSKWEKVSRGFYLNLGRIS